MEYTIIGKIIGSHGIKGDVKVYPLTDFTDRFLELKKAYISDEKIQVKVKSAKIHKGLALLRFEDLEDINKILHFKDQYLYVDDEDKVILPENFFFISDLIDCKVYNTKEIYIGTVTNVIKNAANDVYVINPNKGREFLIPAVKTFVKFVDIENKKIIIDPIEGMIE